MYKWFSALLFCFSVSHGSDAMTPIQRVFGKKPPLGKSALYSFVFKVYEISLWGENRECAEKNACSMAIETIQNWGADQGKLVGKTMEKIKSLHPTLPQDVLELYEKELKRIYPKRVESGDHIQILFDPMGQHIDFYHKAKEDTAYAFRGRVQSESFSRHFFDIWIHPKTMYQRLRQDLLGSL